MDRLRFRLTRGRSLSDAILVEVYLSSPSLVTTAYEPRYGRITALEVVEAARADLRQDTARPISMIPFQDRPIWRVVGSLAEGQRLLEVLG